MKRAVLTSIAALATLALPSFASTIAADGTYHEFLFGTAISPVSGCGGCGPTINPVAEQLSTAPWTFTSTGSVTLFVLDLFLKGDRFQFFDNSLSVGSTSVIPNTGVSTCDNNIGCAIGDTGYSRLTVTLGAGSHSLTGNVIQNALGSGGGAAVFSVSAVPEPGTFGLMFGAAVVGLLASDAV